MTKSELNRMLVVGGRQRKNALDLEEWMAYEKAIILEVDLDDESVRTVVEYASPKKVCADVSPSIVFKSGCLSTCGRRLLVCTQTEILEYDTENWERTYYFSHRSFNDLHHATYEDPVNPEFSDILVANTGLDQVLKLSVSGGERTRATAVSEEWSTCEQETWQRFDRKTDYRKVETTKPHLSHPNYVFLAEGDIWVTRFHQQDALSLSRSGARIQIEFGNPHDGIVLDNEVFFTTTNGNVVKSSIPDPTLSDARASLVLDLNKSDLSNELLGWCRGICIERQNLLWVGFSRIRPTWLRKNLSWVKQGFKARGQYGTRPTRISCFELPSGKLIKEFDLEPYGMNAVFGIYPLAKE